MKYIKLQRSLGISAVMVLLLGAAMSGVAQQNTGDEMSHVQIFKKVQARYAALTSYSDRGQVVTITGETNVTAFTTRLARENFYRVEWTHNDTWLTTTKTVAQAVWSSGVFHLLETGGGAEQQYSLEVALASAAAPSRGAATTIPLMFFGAPSRATGLQLEDWELDVTRLKDEPVDGVDCYVFARTSEGVTKTLWIGKEDLLIHQLQTVTSPEAVQIMLARLNTAPALIGMSQGVDSLAFTTLETHTNIKVDTAFSRSDFVPSFPSYSLSRRN